MTTQQAAEARARQRAPAFQESNVESAFVFAPPHRMEGRLRNAGEADATVWHARLHREAPGAAPAGMRAIYPSGSSEPSAPVLVPHGIDLGLVFDSGVLRGVAAERLTIVLEYEDDAGFAWMADIVLRRKNTDAHGRQRWTVRKTSSRMTG
jgi:hypothetical protein